MDLIDNVYDLMELYRQNYDVPDVMVDWDTIIGELPVYFKQERQVRVEWLRDGF